MANVKQVAARAGVSPATVSRVLNGVPGVTPDLRSRVHLAAAEMGYRPNRIASNFRRQKTATIGVVISDIENPHFSQMVRTIEAAAFDRGYRVLLCNTDELASKQQAYLEVLAAERVEGVILVPIDSASDEVGRLIDLGIPVVALDRVVSEPRADAVVIDNAGGVRRAVDLLLDAGHGQIGFVGGWPTIQTGAERLAGYEAAMRSRGGVPRFALGEFRIAGGQAATEEVLDANPSLTALVVGNNLMTIGALHALRSRGVRIPEDIALVAIDDPFWTEFIDPPLTCMAQPSQQMATSSVDLLFERIGPAPRTQSRQVVYSFELRVRKSCGTAGTSRPDRQAILAVGTR